MNEHIHTCSPYCDRPACAIEQRNSLREYAAGLEKDAARYKWLREYNTSRYPKVAEAFVIGDATLDKAIDAAMAHERTATEGQ